MSLGAVEGNVAADIERRRVRKERREPIILPDRADVALVLNRAPGRFADIIRFALLTGMRQEEIAGLTWRQVDPKAATVPLSKTKTSRVRAVPLDAQAVKLLGARYTGVASRLRKVVMSAQEQAQDDAARKKLPAPSFRPFRFHDLRHRFAVDCLRDGGSIYDLQQILGHASIKTTELYLAFLTPDEAATSKFGRDLGPARNPAQL